MSPGLNSTLRSLQNYASGQQTHIDDLLLQRDDFRDFRNPNWKDLFDSAWGANLDDLDTTERVQRGLNPIDDSLILPDVVPLNCNVMPKSKTLNCCWNFRCKKIFIRSEYKEAEEFAISACANGYDALVVGGRPGIGKSIFLLRVLLRRLALRLPTALQTTANRALLFCEGCVKEFADLHSPAAYFPLGPGDDGPLGKIWALVASDWHVREPAWVLQEGSFFVVEAAPPGPTLRRWTRKLRRKDFYMRPWSFSEVLQARSLIGRDSPSEKQLWYLHHTYGASLRSLFLFTEQPGDYDSRVATEINRLSPSGLANLLRSSDIDTDDFYFLMSIGPSSTDRTEPVINIASPYLLEECCKRVLRNRVDEIKELFDMLKKEPTRSAAAGVVFAYRAHQFLQEGRVIDLFPILGRITTWGRNVIYDGYAAASEADRKRVALPKSKGLVCTDDIGGALEVNTYYRPRDTDLFSIDSWFLLQPTPEKSPILLTIQIALDVERYDAKRSGLDEVGELRVPEGILKCLVVFTPTGVEPEIVVTRDYLTDEFLDGRHPNVALPDFHCQISYDVLFQPPSS